MKVNFKIVIIKNKDHHNDHTKHKQAICINDSPALFQCWSS